MATQLRSKISVQLFGAAQIKGKSEDVRSMVLGVMGGVANGLFAAKAQDGVTDIWGLKGNFYAQVIKTAEDGTKTIEVVESGKCYLPDAIQSPIEDMFLGTTLKNDDGTDKMSEDGKKKLYEVQPISSIEFGYKVIVERAGNKAGYTYAFEPVKEASANDPLAQAKADAAKLLGFDATTQKALAAPAAGDKAKK